MTVHYDQIDDYVTGRLAGAELIAFEKALSTDAELKSAVDNHPAALLIIDSLIEEEARKAIATAERQKNNIQKENTSSLSHSPSVLRRIMPWVAAASTIGAVILWSLGLYQHQQMESQILATYAPDIKISTEKGGTQTSTKDSIIHFYQTHRHHAAVTRIDQIIDNDLKMEDRYLYERLRMYALFYDGNYEEAAKQAEQITAMVPEDIEIKYYALLLSGQKAKAQRVLRDINATRAAQIRHFLE